MSADDADLSGPVSLFPLPGVVLLPRAVLPLHIFEERYRRMAADALSGARQIAMALPVDTPAGIDPASAPAIAPVVCVGRITQHERLEDGRYNLLLEGVCRASVVREIDDKPYRRAELKKLVETPVLEIDLTDYRRRLEQFFADRRLRQSDLSEQLTRLIASSIPTDDIVDILTFALIGDAAAKQSILADADVMHRVETAVRLLHEEHPAIPKSAQGLSGCAMN